LYFNWKADDTSTSLTIPNNPPFLIFAFTPQKRRFTFSNSIEESSCYHKLIPQIKGLFEVFDDEFLITKLEPFPT